MKKLITLAVMVIVMTMSALTAFAIDGDGTEETPFLITNQGELELVTDFPVCHFRLGNDIELEGVWIPLCKQTSSGYFKGVFDGAGYTISNLVTDGSEGGLFKNNSGTIKNLNIEISADGMKGSGAVANINSGTILNCVVKGNISGGFAYMGGICGDNQNTVKQCKMVGNVESTSTASYSYVGGICGCNSSSGKVSSCAVIGNITGKGCTGGISGYNSASGSSVMIVDCYYIGSISSTDSYKGGIVGNNSDSYYSDAKIMDCYAVPTFNSSGYGIAYNSGTITTSYYDKTISGLTSTNYGTPKSTAAMKMKQTYAKDWDFENTWGIDKNINNGYPYLLWEYPTVEEEKPYTITNVKITDLSGNELEAIPAEGFYCEINVTKNDNSKNADSVIIAMYDESGELIGMDYMKGTYYQNQTITFGTMIEKKDKNIESIKSFVWDSVVGMIPLSNSIEMK